MSSLLTGAEMMTSWLVFMLAVSQGAEAGTQSRVVPGPDGRSVVELSWDTESGTRYQRNLLRKDAAVGVETRASGKWAAAGPEMQLLARTAEEGFDLVLGLRGEPPATIEAARITFPFDARVTPTTVLPIRTEPDGTLHLPAIVSAPDFGQMLVNLAPPVQVTARLLGSRQHKTLDWVVEFPWSAGVKEVSLQFRAARLPAPKGLDDDARWKLARRGWFDGLNLTSQWGDQKARFSAPVGILGNNVLSDPASCSLWMYADMALFVPELPGGIKTGDFVRRSLDFWLDHRMLPDGNVIGYWDYDTFLDPLPSLLISAWDYVEMSGDLKWLASRIDLLERIAGYAISRDVDGDGLIEAVPPGDRGSLKQPKRSSCWFDAINFGYKDAYSNALMYRGFRCLVDLESRLHRQEKATEYAGRADRLKRAYAPHLLNPETGRVAMWRSKDGELHDYASPIVNGYAIEYGLIDPAKGRDILRRFHEKLRRVGFTNLRFGVPCILDPIRPDDYLQPAIGAPQQPDGRDTWQIYMNGGITAGQVYHYLAAHYVVGMNEEADSLLDAMLAAQQTVGFQNGVQDAFPRGIDWRKWNGDPCGYEGFLADNARFLLAVLTRNAAFRNRLYRPLQAGAEKGEVASPADR
jgi:hypothetical protein